MDACSSSGIVQPLSPGGSTKDIQVPLDRYKARTIPIGLSWVAYFLSDATLRSMLNARPSCVCFLRTLPFCFREPTPTPNQVSMSLASCPSLQPIIRNVCTQVAEYFPDSPPCSGRPTASTNDATAAGAAAAGAGAEGGAAGGDSSGVSDVNPQVYALFTQVKTYLPKLICSL